MQIGHCTIQQHQVPGQLFSISQILSSTRPPQQFIDSFKEFDYSTLPPVYNNITDQESQLQLNPANPNFDYSHFTQLERDALITASSPLSKRLKTRHLTWISLGASIGSGLLISSGSSLAHAGPLGLLIVWILLGRLYLQPCLV